MKGTSHAIIGANSVWILALLPDFSWNPLLLAVGAFGALLPDLDASDAKIKHLEVGYGKGKNRLAIKPFYLPSWIISSIFKHRAVLHSLFTTIIVGFSGYYLVQYLNQWVSFLNAEFWLVLMLGYLSHLLADGLTKSGVPLLWPWSHKFHLLPRSLCVKTGSLPENLISVLALAGVVIFVLLASQNFSLPLLESL